MRDYLTLVTSQATGQPYDRVIRELSRNKWMDPKQAIEYGMIDKVRSSALCWSLACSSLHYKQASTPGLQMRDAVCASLMFVLVYGYSVPHVCLYAPDVRPLLHACINDAHTCVGAGAHQAHAPV